VGQWHGRSPRVLTRTSACSRYRPDFQAKVRIADAEVFAGAIPPRHPREALSWILANRQRLLEKWNELK
jgi:hypothetical protein